MIRAYLATATLIGLGACAASSPHAPAPDASGGGQTASEDPAPTSGESQPVEVPEIRTVAAGSDDSEVVCRRERRTGTHRAMRVCRTRAEIERMATKSKETFEDLNRSQVEY